MPTICTLSYIFSFFPHTISLWNSLPIVAVVCAINRRSAHDPALSRLLHILCILCVIYDMTLVARHLPGLQNASADALFRKKLSVFLSFNPQALPMPSVIPSPLRELVPNHNLSCISQDWTEWLMATLANATTRAAYASAQRQYAGFCHNFGIDKPFLVSEENMCHFVASMAQEGLKHRTIKAYLSGIRFSQLQHAFGNPAFSSMHQLEYVLAGIKRPQAHVGVTTKPRLPITLDILTN